MPILCVETDHDFSIRYNGEVFFNEISLTLDSVDDLDRIEVLGPWGIPYNEDVKDWEFRQGIEEIKKNPGQHFNNTGGNRGVEWWPDNPNQTTTKEKKYAQVAWTIDDVLPHRPNWSRQQAADWLENNQKYIRDRLVELGNEVIETLLP
jgi:hypothetical protein